MVRKKVQQKMFRGLGQFTLEPGEQVRIGIFYPGEVFAEHGAQYIGGHPENPDSEILAFDQGIEYLSDGVNNAIVYNASFMNTGALATAFSLEGGGFTNQFGALELLTLAPGFENRIRFYAIFNGQDRGALYLAGFPGPPSEIITQDQSKGLTPENQFIYGATFWNNSDVSSYANLMGGQVANQFTFSNLLTLAPGAAGIVNVSFQGADLGPLLISAHPLSPISELVTTTHYKARTLFNQILYPTVIVNTSTFPTAFRVQGGGFA